MDSNERRVRKTSITFRLDENILSDLRKEAERKQISLNTLASQIFVQHVKWHTYAVEAGFIPVRKGLIKMFLDKLSDQDISDIARMMAKGETKDTIFLMRKNYTILTALDLVESWIRISGFPYRRDVENNIHKFVIQHDMGKKWSLYLAELFRVVAEELAPKKTEFQVTESSVVFKVDTEHIEL